MKSLFKTSFVSTLAVFAQAAGLPAKTVGSGKVTSETRSVSGFHGLDLLNSGNVIVTQGDTEGLVVEAEDNLIPLIETQVENGILRLKFRDHEEIHATKPILFKVSVKTFDSVVISGSGNIGSKALTADHFAVKVLGSGNISVDHLETGALAVDIDGSGDVKLAGKATQQTVSVNGSGDYEATELKTGTATLNLAGSGDADVAASETLGVNISGSGDVGYYGKPTVSKHISGSGGVQSLGAEK